MSSGQHSGELSYRAPSRNWTILMTVAALDRLRCEGFSDKLDFLLISDVHRHQLKSAKDDSFISARQRLIHQASSSGYVATWPPPPMPVTPCTWTHSDEATGGCIQFRGWETRTLVLLILPFAEYASFDEEYLSSQQSGGCFHMQILRITFYVSPDTVFFINFALEAKNRD
ncbi:hypothetical protein BGZ61DRAFT_514546 [Ilyonectria robusta]|uniref:uncharacterized protein n=1 Tax=Ilyonectria robusta TaxID=1079257 RepID=UPI001E8E9B9C|nr:uncharacterized protein BGZ61DRAFT_514546 [Ilyonectria robusta]KAH8735284.1 hypothetical protein BGZ61DRAFT_514546 [Ilyonectria robusta]